MPEPTATPVVPTVGPTPAATPPAPKADPAPADPKPEKTLTQEEVSKIVVARVERERETIAKAFGLQVFSKEAIDAIAKEYPTLKTTAETAANKEAELTQELSKRDKIILGYENGINRDKIDEAVTLAEMRMQKDNKLTLDAALKAVITEYPTLGAPKGKAGMKPGDHTTPPENPYITPALLKKYPHLNKGTNQK